MSTLQSSLKRILTRRLSEMNVFTQKLNPITGQSDWIVQNQDYDFHQEVARSSFADMLHDTERNKKYDLAIIAAVKHVHSSGRKANVLDIGTGTGLLSLMAARAGADSVVACEAFAPMSQCAEKIIRINGLEDKISVVPKRSTELVVGEDLKFKANILVTEVFDTELIGEGALNTFKHAHEYLLETDCVVIPQSATIYAHIIESPFVQNWNKLKDVYDEDGQHLLKVPESIKECPGVAAVHDVQLSQLPSEFFNTIISPQAVFQFDWSGKTPFVYERYTINTCRAERDGTAQAVFMWWELKMDVENKIILSCAPSWARSDFDHESGEVPWRDHWMQAIYYLPREVKAHKDDELSLISCHDEFSLWFNLRNDLRVTDADYVRPFCHCNVHIAYPRTRIGQLNDGTRTKKFLNLLQKYVNDDSVVLILSHGFYHALAVKKMGAKRVICVESNMLSRALLKSFVQYNVLSNVEVIESIEDLHEHEDADKINLVFGEPYFTTSILPWDTVLFSYLLAEFRIYCKPDVMVLPRRAIVRGVAVEFKDLHKIRTSLHECEGFTMKPFDDLIEASSSISDDNVEPQPLWEYPAKALSKPVNMAVLDSETLTSLDENIEKQGTFKLEWPGKCNGVALWVDWEMDEEKKCVVSTGPTEPIEVGQKIVWNRHVRQGVHLINHGEHPKEVNYMFKFDCNFGTLSFKFY